jgi:hypothetical protein
VRLQHPLNPKARRRVEAAEDVFGGERFDLGQLVIGDPLSGR